MLAITKGYFEVPIMDEDFAEKLGEKVH